MHLSNVLAIALLVASASAVVPPSMAQETTAGQTSADEAAFWEMVRDSGDTVVLERFLQRFPGGLHAADARSKLDALTESGEVVENLRGPAASQEGSSSELVKLVQFELQRAGCSPGTPDGDWGGRSRAALTRFAEAGNIALPTREPVQELLDLLRSRPEVACITAVGAPTRTENSPETAVAAKLQAGACAVVKVRAAKTKPNGKEWDVWAVNGAPEPDIVISVRNLKLSARCDNSFSCQLKVPSAPGTLSLKIIDYDNTLDETIGQGSCELGGLCQFESATVTFGKC